MWWMKLIPELNRRHCQWSKYHFLLPPHLRPLKSPTPRPLTAPTTTTTYVTFNDLLHSRRGVTLTSKGSSWLGEPSSTPFPTSDPNLSQLLIVPPKKNRVRDREGGRWGKSEWHRIPKKRKIRGSIFDLVRTFRKTINPDRWLREIPGSVQTKNKP